MCSGRVMGARGQHFGKVCTAEECIEKESKKGTKKDPNKIPQNVKNRSKMTPWIDSGSAQILRKYGVRFCTHFCKKNIKRIIGELIEIQCRKPLKMHATIHPNSSRNQCRNSFKINAQMVPELLAQNIEKHAFLKSKNMQIRRKGHRI